MAAELVDARLRRPVGFWHFLRSLGLARCLEKGRVRYEYSWQVSQSLHHSFQTPKSMYLQSGMPSNNELPVNLGDSSSTLRYMKREKGDNRHKRQPRYRHKVSSLILLLLFFFFSLQDLPHA